MSALEKLIAEYQRDLYKPEREHLRRAELEAMQMYNEIAHELAERIIGDEKAAMAAYRPGLMWAAEVIDPQPDPEAE